MPIRQSAMQRAYPAYTEEQVPVRPDQVRRRRLQSAIERAYDHRSAALLSRLGARTGARVLLVGAGGSGLVRWAANAVGPTGRVAVTGTDTDFLDPVARTHPNVRVLRGDAESDELPDGMSFDLVHARLVLGGMRQRERVLEKMAAALAPGGTMLAEDFDWSSYGPAVSDPGASATMKIFMAHIRGFGFDLTLGRRLPCLLRDLGLRDVDADGLTVTLRGASSPLEPAHRELVYQALGRLRGAGLVNPVAAKTFIQRVNDPEYDVIAPTLMSVWGHRPGAATAA